MRLRIAELKRFRIGLLFAGLLGTGTSLMHAQTGSFTDANWMTLGSGMGTSSQSRVSALILFNGDLYAGGGFQTAGGLPAANIAKWDRKNWSPLGAGTAVGSLQPNVRALAVSGGDLYVGGEFLMAGGIAANFIAKWNGNNWTNVGSGLPDPVIALAVLGSDLYAGGSFGFTEDGNGAYCVAKWDGTNWTYVGSGMGGGNLYVRALAVSGTNLYAAGSFTRAGGVPANSIAKWDGSTWSPLGSGLVFGTSWGYVDALAVSGNDLYTSGYITTAGGVLAANIAKWNGSSWTNLGSGLNDLAVALAVSGGNLYAAGPFTIAGGVPAAGIAKWDGTNWSALGSGLGSGDMGAALAISGNDLYVGGFFTSAGGKPAPYIARAYLPALPALSVLGLGSDVKVSWPSADTSDFTLEQADTPTAPITWLSNTASMNDDGTNKWVTFPATNKSQVSACVGHEWRSQGFNE